MLVGKNRQIEKLVVNSSNGNFHSQCLRCGKKIKNNPYIYLLKRDIFSSRAALFSVRACDFLLFFEVVANSLGCREKKRCALLFPHKKNHS